MELEGTSTRGYPQMAAARDRVEPAPRRVRGVAGDQLIFDTTQATYVWETPYYPQYYIPVDDVAADVLVDADRVQKARPGTPRTHHLLVGGDQRDRAARVYGDDAAPGRRGRVRFRWDALDAWFEEDEEIFVHPRNPYVRVDALRSQRHVTVSLEGMLLAETRTPVLLFETGLPTRYYVPRTDARLEHLVPSTTTTECPYKGTTSEYWSVRTPTGLHEDLAWSYRFTTDAVRSIAGLVAFYDEKVDVTVDGEPQARPDTKFS